MKNFFITLSIIISIFSLTLFAQGIRIIPSNSLSPKILHSWTTSTSNSGTTETTLATYTLPANTLTADGQHIRVAFLLMAANNSDNKTFKFYVGANVISSPSIITTGNAYPDNASLLTRTTSSTLSVQGTASGASTSVVTRDATFTGMTFTAPITIKVTGTADASADLTFVSGYVEFLPAGGLN